MPRVCKVLIVEDNDDLRDLLHDLFNDEGYKFAVAADGSEMRSILAVDSTIDIVLIDLTLPGEDDGMALAREAALLGHNVILVSGDHSRYEEIMRSGHRFLMKPFRMQSLLQLVENVLRDTKNDCERRARPPQATLSSP